MNFLRTLFAALFLTVLSATASAQELRLVYDPVLEGGEVYVQDVMHVRYVGDSRWDGRPQVLRTAWWTKGPKGVLLKVEVLEVRLPGQKEEAWKAEHRRLVAKVASAFPPLSIVTR